MDYEHLSQQKGLRHSARAALAAYIERQPSWDCFFTSTFKYPTKSPWCTIDRVTAAIKQNSVPVRGFIAAERHLSGDFHAHGLIAFSPRVTGDPSEYAIQSSMVNKGLSRLGWATLAEPRSIGGVAGYCSKYLTKDDYCEWAVLGNEWL